MFCLPSLETQNEQYRLGLFINKNKNKNKSKNKEI